MREPERKAPGPKPSFPRLRECSICQQRIRLSNERNRVNFLRNHVSELVVIIYENLGENVVGPETE